MAQIRKAVARWQGDLVKGTGTVSSATTAQFKDVEVSWGSRTEEPAGKSSPEELLAAAHAACFSMAFASRLAKNGTPPTTLEVTAAVTFDKKDAGWGIAKSELSVRGNVPGIDAAKFRTIAEDAKENCPVSVALKGNVALSVSAELAG
ncbi:MAG TPA: OsmC family peroxiredoxin [Candidatus Limnocylindria bacterium]|nr:OsmC family peroxiredoxin [Candidatus Limnocylindria bacterium]